MSAEPHSAALQAYIKARAEMQELEVGTCTDELIDRANDAQAAFSPEDFAALSRYVQQQNELKYGKPKPKRRKPRNPLERQYAQEETNDADET